MALNSTKQNSLLLFVQGDDQKFMALEMINRKIYLLWNLGADTAVIVHPTEIKTRDPKYDDAWYRLEVTRTLNIASLTVRRMTNSGVFDSAKAVTGASSHSSTTFYAASSSRIYVGGVPEAHRPSEIKNANGLAVIVHQLYLDNTQYGLWHFASSAGSCNAAMLGASETLDNSNSRHFSGQGYSVGSSSRSYSKLYFSLQITFRTLDENALLFLTVDTKNVSHFIIA